MVRKYNDTIESSHTYTFNFLFYDTEAGTVVEVANIAVHWTFTVVKERLAQCSFKRGTSPEVTMDHSQVL